MSQRKLVVFVSLVLFSTLIFSYLWWGRFQYHYSRFLFFTYVSALFVVAANHVYHRDTFETLGLRFDNLRLATSWYGGFTLALGSIIGGLGLLRGDPRLDRWSDLYTYFAWAAIQQYLLQNFLRLRSEELFSSPVKPSRQLQNSLGSVFTAAGLFAIYHLPNYSLVCLTFLGGLLWCFLFVRIPNLFWAWLSQALLGTVFLLFFKYDLANEFQIGHPGYRYEFYGSGVKVGAGYDAQGNPIVATLPGADKGTKARVRVFTTEGRKLAEWEAFKELDFSGEIAVGDLGFGPGDEVAIAPGPGPNNPALVRIFDLRGNLLGQFQPDGLNFGYGAWLSIHCKRLYVCPGPGPGRPQQVLEFSPQGRLLGQREFRDLGLVNGLRVAALCCTTGLTDNRLPVHEPVTGTLLLWASDISVNPSTIFVYDALQGLLRSFETLTTDFGVQATLVKLAEDRLGLGVAPGPLQGYPPLVQIFDLSGTKLYDFSASEDPKSCGSNIAAVDVDGDGKDELVLGEGIGPKRPPLVRICRLNGQLITQWKAYE